MEVNRKENSTNINNVSIAHDSLTSDNDTKQSTSMTLQLLPLPKLPPPKEFHPVEKFVTDAILSRHASTTENAAKESKAAAGYRAILHLLRERDDMPMLTKVLLALRTSGHGNTLNKISSESRRHAQLVHLFFRLDPFAQENGEQMMKNGERKRQDMEATDDEFGLAKAHLNLVVALVSANSVFLSPALNAVWNLIVATPYYEEGNDYDNDGKTDEEAEGGKEEPKQIREDMIPYSLKRSQLLHATLRKILHLVPKGKTEIFHILASSFPFKLHKVSVQLNYIKQCLIVLQYVPTIHGDLLELFMDKCLEMDVEIRIGDGGLVELEEQKNSEDNQLKEGMPGLELTDDGEDPDQIKEDSKEDKKRVKEMEREKENEERVKEMAEKLDYLLLLIFKHTHSHSEISCKGPRQLYNMVMPAFDSVILTTHKSKFVQFIILILCGLDYDSHVKSKHDNIITSNEPRLYREFAAKLIDLVLDQYRATITRQSSACYLASFISRASYICAETACEAVSALLRFAEAYMDNFPTEASARNAWRGVGVGGSGNDGADKRGRIEIHSLFYTVCQAAFYIMCFRGRECINYYKKALAYHETLQKNGDDDDSLLYGDPKYIDISIERWNRLCSYHLQPLRYCLESVRGEFLLLADVYQLLNEKLLKQLLVEDNKMTSGVQKLQGKRKRPTSIRTAAILERKRLNGGVGGMGRGSNPLDSFFPFDPYLLRRSYPFVEPYYRDWQGSASPDDSITEENDEKEETTFMAKEDTVAVDGYGDSDNECDSDESEEDNQHMYSMSDFHEEQAILPVDSTSSSINKEHMSNEIPKDAWVHELKRARALSMSDECW